MEECPEDFLPAQRRFIMQDLPPVIGHRGAALAAPENTLAGIREAKRQGARWVEVDVKISGDRQPFLLHDDDLERTSDGRGSVLGRPLAELQALDAGGWFGAAFAGERLPTLAELFDLLIAENMSVNLEIKPNAGEEVSTTQAVIEAISRDWPRNRPKPLLSSFSPASLAAARDMAPLIPRGLLIEAPDDRTLPQMATLACASLHVDAEHCDLDWLAATAELGIPVLCYTVNEPARALQLLDAGAHSIITDAPGAIIKALLDSQ